jgi:transketolase C-terminal domain/subunit/transketolase N-terminal domain/subunit
MSFPIDLSVYKPLTLDPALETLSPAAAEQLAANIQLARDSIVFFTALAHGRGLGGHTGGAYDITPEVLLADAFMRGDARIAPHYYDEAGHRVAIQYLMSVLNGHLGAESLLHYREAEWKLPGHPERGFTPGVTFSSGRLGHLWPYLNGVAARQPDKLVLLFGSDGSQQEGNNAEAARFAVARGLEVKLIIDDNDVTISGHPSEYLRGYDLQKTLSGHGLSVSSVDGEDVQGLFRAMRRLLFSRGPAALLCKRRMAPGILGIEGSPKGHDAIAVPAAIEYLRARGRDAAVRLLQEVKPASKPPALRGCSVPRASVRNIFGEVLCDVLTGLEPEQRTQNLVIDSDLAGSCGLHHVAQRCPDVYVSGGIMERGNFSAAAGFGSEPGYQGVFGTFSAFLEMIVSEISMARLNECNVLAHFSHAGVAEILDNTCHFGINNFFADNGLGPDDPTRLYFPADQHQMRALVRRVFADPGLRFVFSPRSALPDVLNEQGEPIYGPGYRFEPGKDEVIRSGSAGWVVSYGDVLSHALDAVTELREAGLDVGLLNKCTLNQVDEASLASVGKSGFVLVAESQNVLSGLGSRYGTWLLERGLSPRYARLGTHLRGQGGGDEQVAQQGLDATSIRDAIKKLSS